MAHSKPDYTTVNFINPLNGYAETIDRPAAWLTFLFGPFYLAYRGAWGAAFLLLLVSVPFLSLGLYGLVFVMLFNVFFAAATSTILARQYLRRGWKMEAKSSSTQGAAQPSRSV